MEFSGLESGYPDLAQKDEAVTFKSNFGDLGLHVNRS